MKIIERYVLQSFLVAFALSWLVLTFVLSIGLLVKITRLLVEGLPMRAIGLFLLIGLPETLKLTLPLALLVSSLLVFSRLSADSEMAAMRACGVNLLNVMKWPVLVAALCTLLGFYINNEVCPRGHDVRRDLRSLITVDVGIDLLEPGRMIDDFPNMKIFFERKEGNWLENLLVFDYSHKGVVREIRADKALVSTNGQDLVFDMYKVRVDPIEVDHPGVAAADRFKHVIQGALKQRKFMRKEKDMCFVELRQSIDKLRTGTPDIPESARLKLLSIQLTEYQSRFVYAFAAIGFVLIGVPLGIRSHRKESTIGMAISLAVALSYYLLIILAESLDKYPSIYPYVVIWMPVAICGVLASILIPKNL